MKRYSKIILALKDLIVVRIKLLFSNLKIKRLDRRILKHNINIKRITDDLDNIESYGLERFKGGDKKLFEDAIKLGEDFHKGKFTPDQYQELLDIIESKMSYKQKEKSVVHE